MRDAKPLSACSWPNTPLDTLTLLTGTMRLDSALPANP